MTAEVAILNRSAVALAADSAVTLQLRGQPKIYNGADKIFQLSVDEPVGIMIFGGAEFMSIPLETVVKEFRRSSYCKKMPYIKDYAQAFFRYLESLRCPRKVVNGNIEQILSPSLSEIYHEVFRRLMLEGNRGRKSFPAAAADATIPVVREAISKIESKPDSATLSHISYLELARAFITEIESAINNYVPWMVGDPDKTDLIRLCLLLLKKETYSAGSTGFVFAGFGSKELFPSMQAFDSDGIMRGRVKHHSTVYVDIRRTGTGSHVEPFAQKEMVERFLDGIDPNFDAYIHGSMRAMLEGFGDGIVDQFVRGNKKKKYLAKQAARAGVDAYMKDFAEQSNTTKRDDFRQKVLDMVHFMPKSELGTMAEALVSLTSMKRRVSAEVESVGGPVDVAVISKGEGFVWIKRKHYFDAALNPRYFLRERLVGAGGTST